MRVFDSDLLGWPKLFRPQWWQLQILQSWFVCFLSTHACLLAADDPAGPRLQRPNVVWVISEDNSKHYLKHFDPTGVATPNIAALAAHGVTFDRAFSNSPVCSVARTTLMTGTYAPRIGAQYHRKIRPVSLPESLPLFPAILRQHGYYTTNRHKEDYNVVRGDDVWDDSSKTADWNNRPSAATPFFHMQSTSVSHESSLHFPRSDLHQPTATDQQRIDLQPYFPRTPLFRYTRARYHDRIAAVDRVVGETIAELQAAGELENTFVFYFGDHGGVLPRSKGYLYETGLHVPLVIRIPANFQSLAGRDWNTRVPGMVAFIDMGPTVLRLAGIESPSPADGRPVLGPDVDPREVDGRHETIGYADRFDEKYDLVRSLRLDQWKYIRNFEPFYPDALHNQYRYRSLAYQQWRELYQQDRLNPVQRAFFEPKAAEALYDLASDPHETNNLAGDPRFAARLQQMRAQLNRRLQAWPDLSFFPEAVLMEQLDQPLAFGQRNQDRIARYLDTANLALLPFPQARDRLTAALRDEDWLIRYWALVAATSHGGDAAALLPLVRPLLNDTRPLLAMRAVEFVAVTSQEDPREALYGALQRAGSEPEALRLLNTAVFLQDHFDGRLPIDGTQIQFSIPVAPDSLLQRRLDYLRS